VDNRADIRDFLASRRGKLSPERVGLPTSTRRRVPGLRREEVAVLAGVSTEWYTRLEKGHIAGVSEDVLCAVAHALQLDDEERTYLFDLARAARPARSTAPRRRDAELSAPVQWMLDSISLSAAFVRNGRLDVIATNPLARALHAPMFASPTTTAQGRANFARYHFLDDTSRNFFVDWESGAAATVALLRAEAGREPHDRALRELVGELSTLSTEFRTLWASHDIRIRHGGVKRLHHPEVGDLEVTYQSLDLPTASHTVHDLSLYTAEPGTAHEERLRLLAIWSAPSPRTSGLTPTRRTGEHDLQQSPPAAGRPSTG
jgi:transcriptional regulator with XRE-family HTH domain